MKNTNCRVAITATLKNAVFISILSLLLLRESLGYSVGNTVDNSDISKYQSRFQRQLQLLERAKECTKPKNNLESIANGETMQSFKENINHSSLEQSTNPFYIPNRPLSPPFPNGLNGGTIISLPPSEHYILDEKFSDNQLLLPHRDIDVWLPPDYQKYPNMRFPVLYCHDGQNVMDDKTSWTGYSWRMAGAFTRLSERRMLKTTETHSPPIIVMIPCATENLGPISRRHLEYGDITQPFAQAHADFVALTLKPLIDERFRTLADCDNTAVIGSSLGGQASLHMVLRYPDLFGKVACLSPAFQPGILTSVASSSIDTWNDKVIYMDNGGDMDDKKVDWIDIQDHLTSQHWWNPGYWFLDTQLQPGIDAMKLALDVRGIKYTYKKFPGGRHNERGWANRIHEPLLALYGL
jgi:predicted alpha/beta superfamily hydrolase